MDFHRSLAPIATMGDHPFSIIDPSGDQLHAWMLALALPPEGVTDRWTTEAEGLARLAEIRWPDGPRCDRCGGGDVAAIRRRIQLRCRACGRQFSLLVGTALERTTTPLLTWLRATEVMILKRAGALLHRDQRWLVTGLAKHLHVSRTTAMRLDGITRIDVMARPPGLLARAVTVQCTPLPAGVEPGDRRHLLWAFRMVIERWPEVADQMKHLRQHL